MTNINKLKSKIIEKGFTITSLAEKLDISKTTLSQKINGKIKFSADDIKDIDNILEFSSDEIREIFLNWKLLKTQQKIIFKNYWQLKTTFLATKKIICKIKKSTKFDRREREKYV